MGKSYGTCIGGEMFLLEIATDDNETTVHE